MVRDHYGAYDFAFYAAGMLCLFAAVFSMLVRAPGTLGRRFRMSEA